MNVKSYCKESVFYIHEAVNWYNKDDTSPSVAPANEIHKYKVWPKNIDAKHKDAIIML